MGRILVVTKRRYGPIAPPSAFALGVSYRSITYAIRIYMDGTIQHHGGNILFEGLPYVSLRCSIGHYSRLTRPLLGRWFCIFAQLFSCFSLWIEVSSHDVYDYVVYSSVSFDLLSTGTVVLLFSTSPSKFGSWESVVSLVS